MMCKELFMEIQVGRGDKVSFWDDKWLGDGPIKAEFLNLYRVSMQKVAVQEVLSRVNVNIEWNLNFAL